MGRHHRPDDTSTQGLALVPSMGYVGSVMPPGRHRPAIGRWDASLAISFPQRYVLGFGASEDVGVICSLDQWTGQMSLTSQGWAESLGMPEDFQRAIGAIADRSAVSWDIETPDCGLGTC